MKIIFRNIHGKEYFHLFLGLLLVAFQVRLDLLFPEYLKTISELLQITGAPFFMIIPSCLAMLACAVANLVCGVGSVYFISRLSALVVTRIRQQTFNKVVDFSQNEVAKFTVPSLLSRCNFDITQIQNFIVMLPQVVVRAPLTGALAAINLSYQSHVWTLIVAGVLVFTIVFIIALITMLTPKMDIVNKLTDKLNRISMEHITGLRVIHAYNAYTYQKKRFNDVNTPLTDVNININTRMAIMFPVLTILSGLGGIFVYLSGAYMIDSAIPQLKPIIFSDMIVAFFYSGIVIISFMMITMLLIQLPRMLLSTKRINEVLESPVSILDGTENSPEKLGTIEFQHVNFKYPEASENAIEDINFKAEKGQTVAFIGSTGCGKTSILNLIPRIYDASEGKILVDGVDVKDFKLKDLRERIGYVPQKNILFNGTISENINYGGINHSENEVLKAAKIGQAEEFISQRPEAYSSIVEHGGANFSGGQKQRLTISRAVCKNPEIFLFDDSFSALDLVTDKKLRQSLKENSKGATILIAAQRISTIIDADNIIVIDKGRVVAQGKHQDLMKSCEIYQEIAKSQMGQD